MKPVSFIIALSLFALASLEHLSAQIFTGEGNWLAEDRWDDGIPADNSVAVVNGTAVIAEDIVAQNSLNPGRVVIGEGTEGSLTVSGGTLSGAHGGGSGVYVGAGAGGKGTLIIEDGAAFRSQGGNMTVRIGDDEGGQGTVVVAGELLNYKFFEIINGTLEMRPTGINAKFNEANPRSLISPNGTLSFVIDGDKIGSLKRSNNNGLNVDIDPGATLKVALGGEFSVGDSWLLMDYTAITGQFAQGTAFVNEQGFEFQVDYGSGSNDVMTLTLISTDARPQIEAFTADLVLIASGESTTLSWQVTKSTSITIDQGVGAVTGNTGSAEVSPTETTTYTLTVDFNGILATRALTVVVDAVPLVETFTVAPELVAPGGEAILRWNVAGADSVDIEPGIGAVASVGQVAVNPDETTSYKLTAQNANGSTSRDVSLTVNALEAAIINLYDAAAANQTDGALKDAVGQSNWDVKNGELVDVTSERTTITRAHKMVTFNNDTGSDNGNGYPGANTTYEVWVKTGDFIEELEHQVIFETGGGGAGTGILVTPESVKLLHSSGGERTIDIAVARQQINFAGDYVQIVASINAGTNMATLSVRGAGGGSALATGSGTIGSPIGRATLFSHSNFSAGIAGALGGSGNIEPEGTTQFTGEIAVLKIYNRALDTAEIDQAFKKLAVEGDDDADNDGLLDFWEVNFFGNTNAGANGDNDNDGLTNRGEFENGAFPDNPDSDGDGLRDGDEVNTYASSPTNTDSDGDGLSDGREVNELKTAPGKADTDDDGFRDDVELALATDPTSSDSAPPANAILLTRAPAGAEDWNSPEIWADGLAPSADKDYFVVGSLVGTLATPGSDQPSFNGGSLVLAGNANLDLRHTGKATISDLVIRDAARLRVRSSATGLTGKLTLQGALTIEHLVNLAVFDLGSTISGAGAIEVLMDLELEDAHVLLTGPGSAYEGSWRLNGGTLKAVAAGSLGSSDLTIRFGSFDADYNVNLPGKELIIIGGDFALCLDQQLVFKALRGLQPEDETTELFTLPGGNYDVNVLVNDVGFGEDQVKGNGVLIVVGASGDTDNDGLLDSWEMENFGDLAQSGDGDADDDGLSNAAEFGAGSLPNNADTDQDGLNDGVEVNVHGTNPQVADTDGDGLSDHEEVTGAQPSNPLLADSDGDGRSDLEEVTGDPKSDPLLADTDGDGFTDGFEVAQDADPNDAASLPADRLGEPTMVWNVIEALPSLDSIGGDLDLRDATFRVCIDFEAKVGDDRELIFETGGATIGHSVVYEVGNKLVYRADGNGGLSLAVIEYTLTPEQLAAGEIEVIWTYDVLNASGTQTIALYLDGVRAGEVSMDIGGDWSGTNAASFGAASNSIAGDGQNNVLEAFDFESGTINTDKGLQFFADRLFVAAGGGDPDPNVPGADFAVATVMQTANGVALTWEAAAGVAYAVEFSPSLETADWQIISADNTTGTFEDTDPGRTTTVRGFYRLRVTN